jgi:hypothetical protein
MNLQEFGGSVMGFFGYIEIKYIGMIPIRDQKGQNLGNPLAAFFEAYQDFATNENGTADYDWFTYLESKTSYDMRILANIVYSGDEKLVFNDDASSLNDLHNHKTKNTKEEKFYGNNWVNLSLVFNTINEVVGLLPDINTETFWFSSKETLFAFRVFLDVLDKCRQLGGKEIRIHFR